MSAPPGKSMLAFAFACGLSACAARAVPPAAPEARTPATKSEHGPRCPEGMALLDRLQGAYCIDRWEASLVRVRQDGKQEPWPNNRTIEGVESELRAVSVPGKKPQGYVSGAQAERVCRQSGKRLCEVDEWVRACRGKERRLYPYGDQRRAGICNDRFRKLDRHPVVSLFRSTHPGADPKLMWNPSFMNDPRLHDLPHSVSPAGAFSGCTNELGVYDMVGNLHEWVSDAEGTFFGGFFMDTFQNGEGCEYRTVAHPFDYHDYSTGFRCCADPTS